MTRLLCFIIGLYKSYISPFTPPVCRFYPSCSTYALLALKRYGTARGLLLTSKRLLRCSPWCHGGYDPVPAMEYHVRGCITLRETTALVATRIDKRAKGEWTSKRISKR